MNEQASVGDSLAVRIEHLVAGQRRAGLTRGLQAYVSRDGVPLVDAGFGFRNDSDRLVDTNTRFAAFSATKPLTAAALHLLAEAGELTYTDPVVRFIPEFGQEGKEQVTLRHLLLHQAGISDTAEEVPVSAYSDFADAISRICRLRPTSPPGSATEYHVLTGMAVIAEVVQRVSGLDFRTFCDQELFSPLNMVRTTFGLPPEAADEASDTVATSEDRREACRLWAAAETRAALHPAIGAYTTAQDLGRFYESWLGALAGRPGIVSPSTALIATALHARSTPTFGFGYGFMVGTDPALPLSRGALFSAKTFGHPGMCSAQALADPVSGLVVVLLANGDPGQAESDRRFALLCELIARSVMR